MLLVIDVGNTNIVGGIYRGDRLEFTLRIHTVTKKTEDEYSIIFKSLLADRGIAPGDVDRVVISSVVPSLSLAMETMCERLFGVSPWVLGPAVYGFLPLSIPSPHEIGADLVADALAAWRKTGGAAIVVDFGTALTFTCVDAKGAILGVSIAPGLGTAVGALSRDTAQLPNVELVAPPSVIGTNTVMSIQAGIVHGYAGLVTHLVGRMKAEMGGQARVIATGGLCRVVAGLVTVFDATDQDLTLDGLAYAAEYFERAVPKGQPHLWISRSSI
jgi:type III pantothenate kinase